eukprot:Nitzschia sp. Nitz4//scaffold24_size164493//158265//158834//NITZ4_002355-RA/size164493-processed-gene-0.250-mRNA-1//-1//CDS//3329544195//1070//frame0
MTASTKPSAKAFPTVQQVTYETKSTRNTMGKEEPIEAVVVDPNSKDNNYPEASYQQASSQTHGGGKKSLEFYLCGATAIRRMSETAHVSVGLCGNTYIDMRDAQFPPGSEVTLFTARLCGNMELLVPRGTQVVFRRFLLCGTKEVYVEPTTAEDTVAPPSVTITVVSLCGKVFVSSDPDELPYKLSTKL